MSENIEIICGPDGNLDELENIQSNPNFVFENDPEFQTIVLFNESGDVINVNSWLECANYVNGGWISDKIDLINGEQQVFFFILISISLYLAYSKFRTKGS